MGNPRHGEVSLNQVLKFHAQQRVHKLHRLETSLKVLTFNTFSNDYLGATFAIQFVNLIIQCPVVINNAHKE